MDYLSSDSVDSQSWGLTTPSNQDGELYSLDFNAPAYPPPLVAESFGNSPLFGVETPSGLNPSEMFGTEPLQYQNIYDNPLSALTQVQSTYSSDALDPFGAVKKEYLPADSGISFATHVGKPHEFTTSFSQGAGVMFPASPLPSIQPLVPTAAPVPASTFTASTQQPAQMVPVIALPSRPTAASRTTGGRGVAKSRNKKGTVPEALANERRKKHNEVEIRRRQKMNENFDELQNLIEYSAKEKDKASVLRAVIEKLRAFEAKTQELTRHYDSLTKQAAMRVAVQPHHQKLQQTLASMLNSSPFPQITSKVNHTEVFMNNDVPMAVASLKGKIVDANERFLQLMGYDLTSLQQLPCVLLTHPDDLPNLFRHLKDLLAGNITSFTSVKRMLSKDRRYIHFNNTMWVVRAQGQPKYLTGVFIPVKWDDPLSDVELQQLHSRPKPALTCEMSQLTQNL